MQHVVRTIVRKLIFGHSTTVRSSGGVHSDIKKEVYRWRSSEAGASRAERTQVRTKIEVFVCVGEERSEYTQHTKTEVFVRTGGREAIDVTGWETI